MPSTDYTRCRYIQPDTQEECDQYFNKAEGELCPIHRAVPSTNSLGYKGSTPAKESTLSLARSESATVDAMTLEQTDSHILALEAEIEKLKARLLGARASRAGKIEKLSESERQVRRNMRFSDSALAAGEKRERRQRTTEKRESQRGMSLQDKLIQNAMKLGMSREMAEKLVKGDS